MVALYPWVISDFYIQLFAAELMFFTILPKKPGFLPKLAICFVCYAAISFFLNNLFMRLDFMWPYFIILLLLITIIGKLLIQAKFTDILFLTLISYAIQNTAYHVERIMRIILGYGDGDWFQPLMAVVFTAATYAVIYLLLIRNVDQEEMFGITKNHLIALSAVVLSLEYALNILSFMNGESGILLLTALLACAVLTLLLQFNIFSRNRLTREYNEIQALLKKEQEQYAQSKENIELINMKCHDIKHQISNLRSAPEGDFLEEVKNAVNIYDNTAKTGSEALDIILTEKSLYCVANGIQLTYIADGKILDFMRPTDIYSMFGNALANAIECVTQEPDEEKRIINLKLYQKERFVFIYIENYTPSEKNFENVIPETRKDKSYHGYGLKSIRFIAEKYGGQMSLGQKEHFFTLNILFPV